MKPRTNGVPRAQNSRNFQGEGPNWVLLAGGALLSTLSIRLGFKLKQALDTKQQENARSGKSADRNKLGACRLHSNTYSFTREDGSCFNCVSGSEGIMDINQHQPNGQILTESDVALPLVMVPAPEYTKENGGAWASSPERLELPPKPFHHSNCSDSPCVSESGSDIFSKREVIQKLRQQLKKRDDMILEMQDQIMELQNSLNSHMSHSAHLQAQVDAANRDLFDSEREIQRLRKAIADHCVGQLSLNENTSPAVNCLSEPRNGHANGYLNGDTNLDSPEKGRGDNERIEMLKREVRELREVMEGKEYLLQSYKEQKVELSMKIKELQQRLDSQLPNIL